MTKEEARDLSSKCNKYFDAMKKRGQNIRCAVPPTPSIIIIKSYCKEFNISPEQVKKISKRTMEELSILNQVELISDTLPEMTFRKLDRSDREPKINFKKPETVSKK